MTLPSIHNPSLEVKGERLVLLGDGTLFLPNHDTLVVADLHLEKGTALARRGQLLPPYDSLSTLQRLEKNLDQTRPSQVICLGDSFHTDAVSKAFGGPAYDLLHSMMARTQWVWLSGNHDPHPPQNLGGLSAQTINIGPIQFQHEPDTLNDETFQICGHLHPAHIINQRGKGVRKPCFVTDHNRMFLPAYGSLTGGLNISHHAFKPWLDIKSARIWMMGKHRLYEVTPSKRAA